MSNRQDHGGFEIQEEEQEVVSCQKRSSRRRRRRMLLLWRPPPLVKCWARKPQVTLQWDSSVQFNANTLMYVDMKYFWNKKCPSINLKIKIR